MLSPRHRREPRFCRCALEPLAGAACPGRSREWLARVRMAPADQASYAAKLRTADLGRWEARWRDHSAASRARPRRYGPVHAVCPVSGRRGRARHPRSPAAARPPCRGNERRGRGNRGGRAGDVARLPIGMVADISSELGDLGDTAAVIANLDLVIAVDTAVVHLAGALGRPVWAMLAFAPDWRWLLDREDSPWYPSMRLFRQARHGDWDSVLVRIRQALSERVNQTVPEWRPSPAAQPGPPIAAVDPQLVFEAALAHHGAGRLDAAEAAAREAIAHHPLHAGALHLLGIIAIQRGDHQKAVELLNQSIRLDPTAEQAHNNLGIALAGLGRLDEAIASLRKAAELSPGFAVAHYNLGSVLQRANRFEEAGASLRQAIATKPDYFDAHFQLGNALSLQKQFEGAVASYRRAAELRPDLPPTHFGLASALRALERNDEAVAS